MTHTTTNPTNSRRKDATHLWNTSKEGSQELKGWTQNKPHHQTSYPRFCSCLIHYSWPRKWPCMHIMIKKPQLASSAHEDTKTKRELRITEWWVKLTISCKLLCLDQLKVAIFSDAIWHCMFQLHLHNSWRWNMCTVVLNIRIETYLHEFIPVDG